MVAPDAMDDLGMTDSSELVEMFGCRGDREIPEEAVQPYIRSGGKFILVRSSSL